MSNFSLDGEKMRRPFFGITYRKNLPLHDKLRTIFAIVYCLTVKCIFRVPMFLVDAPAVCGPFLDLAKCQGLYR